MRALIVAVVVIGLLGAASAHNHQTHILGTISVVNGDTVIVTDAKGQNQTVNLTTATKFIRGDKSVQRKELQPGRKVVIHAKPVGAKLEAVEIKIAP